MSVQWGLDETNGVIIGGFEVRYEFWQENKTLHDIGYKGETGRGVFDKVADWYFDNDQEALNWFSGNYPDAWNARKERPIEMRVFDQPGRREQIALDIREARP